MGVNTTCIIFRQFFWTAIHRRSNLWIMAVHFFNNWLICGWTVACLAKIFFPCAIVLLKRTFPNCSPDTNFLWYPRNDLHIQSEDFFKSPKLGNRSRETFYEILEIPHTIIWEKLWYPRRRNFPEVCHTKRKSNALFHLSWRKNKIYPTIHHMSG